MARERLAWTETESPWEDPWEFATVDAVLDWKSNLHSCGRPMSESLDGARADIDESSYVVGTRICWACMAHERHRAHRAKTDESEHKNGVNPDAWRLDQIDLLSEAQALYRLQHPDPT